METLSEILESPFSDQGIQDMKVYLDTYIFNLKIKDSIKYKNIVLLEKFSFDYDLDTFVRTRNNIILNFGDTEKSQPGLSKGTGFIDSIPIKSNKSILLVGLKKMVSGKIIPIIYRYDINAHQVKSVFPKLQDIEEFNSIPLSSTFVESIIPCINYKDSKIYLSFHTTAEGQNYIHNMTFNVFSEDVNLENYKLINYNADYPLNILNGNEDSLVINHNGKYGILQSDNSITEDQLIGRFYVRTSDGFYHTRNTEGFYIRTKYPED